MSKGSLVFVLFAICFRFSLHLCWWWYRSGYGSVRTHAYLRPPSTITARHQACARALYSQPYDDTLGSTQVKHLPPVHACLQGQEEIHLGKRQEISYGMN